MKKIKSEPGRNNILIANHGFTFIEAIVSAAILAATMMFALSSINQVVKNKNNSQISTSITSVQQSLIALIKNKYSWQNIIKNNQPSMECLLENQNLAKPDCSAVVTTPNWPQLKVYDSADSLVFDPTTSASQGFSLEGLQTCNTFSDSSGDPKCPLRADIRWRPVCPIGAIPVKPCRWPNIEIKITFQYNAGPNSSYNLNTKSIETTLTRSVEYCPKQGIPVATFPDPNNFGTWGAIGGVNIFGNSFFRNVGGAASDYGSTSNIYSCNNYSIKFNYDLGSTAAVPNNIAKVCLISTTSTDCLYEWRQYQGSWYLYENNGTLVYTKPASTPFNSATGFEFKIISGNVSFYTNNNRVYTFPKALVTPYRVYFNPAETTYSSKIGTIQFTNLSL